MSVIIRLQNLPISANASNIRRFFSGLSIPEGGVHIVGGTEGDAFIAFATDEDARKAMLLDRQSINGAAVRLFLSSKTEMQTIIESARTSAMFSGGGNTALSQAVPQKSEAMHALDVTAPTLPSSFPSYRNGAARESFDESLNQFAYPYNKASAPPVDTPPRAQIDMVARNKPEEYPEHIPPDRIHSDRDRNYGYNNPPDIPSRYDSRDFPPTRDYGPRDAYVNDRGDPPYRYHEDYDYSRRPPPPIPEDFTPRNKDTGFRNSPRDPYPDQYPPRHVMDDRAPDYGKYPTPPPRSNNDRFVPHDVPPREVNRGNSNYPPENRSGPVHPLDREAAYPPNNRLPEDRDFSVRPPWLGADAPGVGPKRPFQQPVPDYEEYPRKRRPPPPSYGRPSDLIPGETEYVLRVCLPVPEAGIKGVFEILRGVQVVPKWGIRVEEDLLQRPTGYVFIMMANRDSYDRALSFDNRPYKGDIIRVLSSSLEEFYNVSDTGFASKCPPEVTKKLPPADQFCPPHYNDGCLELSELPSDTTKMEVVRFVGAPGLTCENVVLARFSPNDRSAPRSGNMTRALVTLPSAADLKILLSAKSRPFRPDSELPSARLIAISKLQVSAYSSFSVSGKSEDTQELAKSTVSRDTDTEPAKATGVFLTCACVSGFSRPVKDSEVLNLFPSILIPGDAVKMAPDGTTAFIDFISENNCRRAVNEASTEGSKAKQTHPTIHIEAISRSEMLNRLGLDTKGDEQSNFDKPVRPRDRDPREPRPQWDPRQRPPHPNSFENRPQHPNSFENRPPSSGRGKYDDPGYDRPGPPAPFEEHRDQFRRFRPPMDNLHSIPPPQSDPVPAPRPPLPAPHRRPIPDFVSVFVGNLPPGFTVDQLAGVMRDYYFIPGSIRLRRNPQGQPTGEALVDFKTSYEADRALRGLNGYRIAGRPLVLRFDHRN